MLLDTHVLLWALGDMEPRAPFDRLLIAQALTEPAWLYTADKLLVRYEGPVRLLDAAS